MKLTEPQRRALEYLKSRREVCLANMEDHAGVTRATLDGLCKRGLIEFGGGEYVSVAATVEHFRNTQAFGLFASITEAGRSALTNGMRGDAE